VSNRDYTADRDLFRDLDDSIRRNGALLSEDDEQAAYLRKWAAGHPRYADRSGCGATATLLLCAVVGLAMMVIGGVAP